MASPTAIFSGISSANFTANIGIFSWSIYDIANDNYLNDSTRALTIDTPNFSTGQNAGSAVNTNGELCGSGPFLQEQAGGPANTRNFGPWKYVGGGGSLATAPGRFGQLGCVKIDDYYTENANGTAGFDGLNFVQNFGDGLWQYDLQKPARTPGNVIVSSDLYSVIMPSAENMGGNNIETGRRVHWDVAVGSLNGLIMKLQAREIGRISVNYGGIIGSGWGDEQTATVWLSNGYGLMKEGSPAFALFN